MSIFPIFKKAPFFTEEEKLRIVNAIRQAEQQTSGEIRVYVESKNVYVDAMDRAAEVFYDLKMDKTDNRNAVLLYIAMKDKELVLFGDEGIYNQTGELYWNNAVKKMLKNFKEHHITEGVVQCILEIGQTLKEKFPYNKTNDKNELPDEIVFGN
ncbi:MAG: TPM domain-containing protein [Ferruginibacter sp.]|nr:TPM domain-containing protein [Ferruginibacter sp.]